MIRMILLISSITTMGFMSGCSVLDNISSGERRIPLSKYALDQFKIELREISKIRRVYDRNKTDVFTYVIGFDGTNNSDDCEMIRGVEPNLIDSLTDKPVCTSVQRLINQIEEVEFSDTTAGLQKRYFSGPGVFRGRILNPFDSLIGYTSPKIADNATNQFFKDMARIPRSTKEVRVVVIGFSRGAAIAREFLNRIHRDLGNRFPNSLDTVIWSTAILVDTVATFQTDNLNLSIPSRTEQVVELFSLNESRIDFKPIKDRVIWPAGIDDRFVIMNFPGAHSDVGASYRYGAGVIVDFAVESVAQEMGLVESVSGKFNDLLNYGLVDSRGWWDRLIGSPSGFSCGFERKLDMSKDVFMSRIDLDAYKERLRSRGAKNLFSGRNLGYSLVGTAVFLVEPSNPEWKISEQIYVNRGPVMGTAAIFSRNSDGSGVLKILDGVNQQGGPYNIPAEVVREIDARRDQIVQVEIAGKIDIKTKQPLDGLWFFVNGCLPMEGIIASQ